MSAQDVLPRLLPLRDWSHALAICALILAAEALFFLVWGLVRTRSRRFAWIMGILAALCAVGSWILVQQALTTYQQEVADALNFFGAAHWVAIGVAVAVALVAVGLVLRAALTRIRRQPWCTPASRPDGPSRRPRRDPEPPRCRRFTVQPAQAGFAAAGHSGATLVASYLGPTGCRRSERWPLGAGISLDGDGRY